MCQKCYRRFKRQSGLTTYQWKCHPIDMQCHGRGANLRILQSPKDITNVAESNDPPNPPELPPLEPKEYPDLARLYIAQISHVLHAYNNAHYNPLSPFESIDQ